MANQTYYEDIEEGAEIPSLEKTPTTTTLVKWAGASKDWNPLHFDKDFAQNLGFKGVIVHGRIKAAYLAQLISNWIGNEGVFQKLSLQYRGNDFPGDKITCKGKVTKKYVKDGEHYVECEIWTENSEGTRTTPGSAIVVLPSKGG
jgi:acyl dehydratase